MLIIEYAHLPKSFHDGYVVSVSGSTRLVIIEESLSDDKKAFIMQNIIRILETYR